MADVFTKEKRSAVMSRIRGRGNKKTELALMALLRRHRINGWRRHQPVYGRPDFVFQKQKVAIFVDGCFWHGCPIHYNIPVKNGDFWRKKYTANKARDRRVNNILQKKGWRIIRIWEHDLSKTGHKCVTKILKVIEKLG